MLRLSNLADYAVVVMAEAAREAGGERTGGERAVSATQVAEETGLPAPTVAKVMGQLARAGLLISQRGASGGFRLAQSAREISLADIVEAIDGPIALTHCGQTEGECDHAARCSVRPYWGSVNDIVRNALAGVTLANLSPARPSAIQPEIA